MAERIPATIVTGFLGAGKTTMIRNLLQNANGARIALIVNEFGDVGVDGDLLQGCGDATCTEDDIVELANGCICCTVAEDFVPTIETLLGRENPPDHIVIETSGLALPQPLVRAFNWPEIRTKVTVDGVVTVVDGAALSEGRFAHDHDKVEAARALDDAVDHETPIGELFEDQVACADMIVVNKTDLISEDQTDAVAAKLSADAREGVRVIRTSKGALGPKVLLGLCVGAEDDMDARLSHHEAHHHEHDDHHGHDDHHEAEHHHHAHDHDAFESFVVTLPEIEDPEAFSAKVADIIRANDILRLKGFLAVLW